MPNNDFSKKMLQETRGATGDAGGAAAPRGAARVCRVRCATWRRPREGRPGLQTAPIEPRFRSTLQREFRLVIAGSAGGKVRSTARMLGEAALLSGLWASQADDYPVTVKTGHSIAELIFSPREILYTGITRPEALIVASEDGYKASRRYLNSLTAESRLFVGPELAEIDTPARKIVLDPKPWR